jgi:hypothetical protein
MPKPWEPIIRIKDNTIKANGIIEGKHPNADFQIMEH